MIIKDILMKLVDNLFIMQISVIDIYFNIGWKWTGILACSTSNW